MKTLSFFKLQYKVQAKQVTEDSVVRRSTLKIFNIQALIVNISKRPHYISVAVRLNYCWDTCGVGFLIIFHIICKTCIY